MTHKRDGVSFSEARVHLFPESPEVVTENYNLLVGHQREPLLPEILQSSIWPTDVRWTLQ